MIDIALINMPYSPLARPSLALGILQAILKRSGRSAKTLYGNLLFAEHLGIEDYLYISRTRPEDALTDWTFAHLAFPERSGDHAAYVDLLSTRHQSYRGIDKTAFLDFILRVREQASSFLDSFVSALLDEQPRIVGCSSSTHQHVASLAVLKRIREVAPDVVTILGGPNCETVMGRTTHRLFPWIDYVVSGEADDLLPDLVTIVLEYGREVDFQEFPDGVFAPGHRVSGYPTIGNDGSTSIPRAVTRSLNNLPPPDFATFFSTLERLPALRDSIRPGLILETSRGCWWGQKSGCTFCGLNGRGKEYRSKRADRVLQEMETVYNLYHKSGIEIVDNAIDPGYFDTVLPRLAASGRPYELFYETRPNLSRRQAKALRDAGVIWIQAGIESLHSDALSLMNKGSRAWQNIQTLKWCREQGIRCSWFLLHDLPYEQDEWYAEMAALAPILKHLQPPGALSPVKLWRYSAYHDAPGAFGLSLVPAQPYFHVYPLTSEQLSDLVYCFEDEIRIKKESHTVLSALLEGHGIASLRSALRDWYRAFWSNARPELTMNVSEQEIRIRDTRGVSGEPYVVLRGIERHIYLTCDTAPKTGLLFEKLSQMGFAQAEIDEAVQRLLDAHLLIRGDDRLTALAVRESVNDLPAITEWPGGQIRPMPGGTRFYEAKA